jgi:hypothetical protein
MNRLQKFGIMGGVLGAAAMNVVGGLARRFGGRKVQSAESGLGHQFSLGNLSQSPSSLVAANLLQLSGAKLTPEYVRFTASMIHYGFGALAGAAYAGVANEFPIIRAGNGAVYGLGIWFIAAEIGLPLARLSRPPWRSALWPQVVGAACHTAYGLVLHHLIELGAKQSGISSSFKSDQAKRSTRFISRAA